MKKICHLTSVHPRYDVRIFHKECISLAKEYSVHLIVADGKGDETIDNVHIFDIGLQKGGRLKRIFSLPNKVLKKAISLNCDIYHFHDPELIRIGLKLKKRGKKVIYDVHEDLPRQTLTKYYLNKHIRPILSRLLEWYENRKSKKMDYIVTSTPFIKDRLIKLNKNTSEIMNFPILDDNNSTPVWSERKKAVCYIGAIAEIRGINEMLEALKDIDCEFLVGGLFDDDNVKQKITKSSYWQKVNYYGYVSRAEVHSIYSTAKAGLVTLHPIINYIDALPVKMFEYMSAGLPVIASNFPLWKEIIEGNKCGICVDPLKPNEITTAIQYLLSNNKIAEEMGNNGRTAVLNKYNWSSEEKELIAIYKSL